MSQTNYKTSWLKFIIGWVICFVIRLIPFRPPNIEPILATVMPFSKKYGYVGGFVFGFLSIAIFDLAVGKIGSWTLITGITYGFLGIGAHLFFKKRKSMPINYLKYAIIGTIVYDALTGLSVGMLIFKQTFMVTVLGQIPFTVMHLLGNVILSVTVSSILYKWIVVNKNLETNIIWNKLVEAI